MSGAFRCGWQFFWMAAMAIKPVQITRHKRTLFYRTLNALAEKRRKSIFENQLPLEKLSSEKGQSVTAASRGAVPDCQSCGLCCIYPMSVSITDNDAAFLKEYLEIVAVKADIEVVVERLLPRDLGSGHCANLRSEAAGRFSCGIYEDRPAVCRSFEAGSDRCHEYRRMYALEPRLDETDLAAELSKIQSALRWGKITSAYISVDSVRSAEGGGERFGQLTVNVYLDNEDKEYELHTYHSPGETWYESDFVGLTIDEARGMIRTGDRQRHRNCNDDKAGDRSIDT